MQHGYLFITALFFYHVVYYLPSSIISIIVSSESWRFTTIAYNGAQKKASVIHLPVKVGEFQHLTHHFTDPEPAAHLAEVHDGAASQEHKKEKKPDVKDTKEGDGDKMEGKRVSFTWKFRYSRPCLKFCDQGWKKEHFVCNKLNKV